MTIEKRSHRLEAFIQARDCSQYLEKIISFLREIFPFSYTKARGDDGVYIWFGDKDWDQNSRCLIAHVGHVSFIFIDYTEDDIIDKYNRYYELKAFL